MPVRVHRFSALAFLLLAPAALHAQSDDPWAPLLRPRTHTPQPTTAAITPADLMTRLFLFADDSMRGRLVATPENVKGVEYIASELRRFGVEPAGENGGYFQTVPVISRVFDSTDVPSVNGHPLRLWTDFIPRDNGLPFRSLDHVEVVYAGDFADTTRRLSAEEAAGKLVVVTSTGQVSGNPKGIPSRPEVANFYNRAAGIAVVGLEDFPASDIATFHQTVPQLHDTGPLPEGAVYFYVTRAVAAELLGGPISAARVGPTGQTISGRVGIREVPVAYPARNVVGIIRGSDPALRNEYVAIGAHNDHIGTGPPVAHDSEYVVNHLFRPSGADDPQPVLTPEQQARVNAILADVRKRSGGASARLDSIYNGADDDGTGSMSVLEIAQYFAAQPVKPKRSLLLVFHVGEEEGLWGSEYFTDHPTVPRDSIVAQLNMDMVGRGGATDITGDIKGGGKVHGGPNYVQLIGSRRLSTEYGNLAETVNRGEAHPLAFDYTLDANGHPQNIYCRSDHYEYARYGIPIIFFTTGGHADYHQVTDEPQYIDYNRMAQVAGFVADMARTVANLDHRIVVDHPKPDPKGNCQQ